MDLLEYQAKKLFAQVGIPVLPSQPVHDPRELKKLQIPYPVVLKSQVSVGGRGRAGGIRFVENTIDAIAAARTIFNLPILNQYPEVVLAEARYDVVEEFFLAIVLDYQLQKPVLLGSVTGGIDIEKLLANLQKVVIEDDFSPFYARRLVTNMGLKGNLIKSVSEIVEKMYYLFLRKDLDLIEINPLGVNHQGELMALDGKITVNNHALPRHPDILDLTTKLLPNSEEVTTNIFSPSLNNFNTKGNIVIITNSLSLALIDWDLIAEAKGKLAGLLTIWQETQGHLLPDFTSISHLTNALDSVKEIPNVKVVLINLIINHETLPLILEGLTNYFQTNTIKIHLEKGEDRLERPTGAANRGRKRSNKSTVNDDKKHQEIRFVIRFTGEITEEIRSIFAQFSCFYTDDLEVAIRKTITLAS
jgi:succinyl-CoA synthetase beta subunit